MVLNRSKMCIIITKT